MATISPPVSDKPSDTKKQRSKKPRPMPTRDTDRVPPPVAAEKLRLRYPDEFNLMRWELERPYDPTAPEKEFDLPEEYRFSLLTRAEERALDEAARAAYLERKAKRMAWARTQHMRVSVWGGRRRPGGEWMYSALRCENWHKKSLGSS